MKIPKSHPRYESLIRREKLVRGWRDGLVVPEGLIAQGRGEAFDYLLGEETPAPALVAEKAAAALLLTANRPVISVNGNVAALAPKEVVRLAKAVPATIEVNLFHRTETRVRRIVRALERHGARGVLGSRADARIPDLDSKRAVTHRAGTYGADVVLVPLEDGDRAEALAVMGKKVISIDLNPLSRTSRAAQIAIVDELSRALPNVERFVRQLRNDPSEARRLITSYSKAANMKALYSFLDWRLRSLKRGMPASPKRRRPRSRGIG